MPTFTATNYSIDMRAGSFDGLADAEVLEHSSTRVSLWNATEQEQYIFTGSFGSFDGDGVPHSGTITGFTLYDGGRLTITGSNIAFPVATFVSYVQSGDFQGFLDALLAGNDTIIGNNVNAEEGMNDYLVGGAGNDSLYGQNGDDQLYGGAGNDVLLPGFGADYIDGGDGIDTVSFSNYGSIGITYKTGTAQVAPGQTITLVNVEQVQGTKFADTMTLGGGLPYTLMGYDGNDKLYAGPSGNLYGDNGDDELHGSSSNDSFHGGAGIDSVYYDTATAGVTVDLAGGQNQITGGAGADSFYGDIENLYASAYNDVIYGTAGDNAIYGGGGDDLIVDGAGADTLDGGTGINTVSYARALAGVTVDLSVTVGQDTLGAGLDTLKNFRNLTGSAFNDKLTGDAQDNILTGGGGNDTFLASKGVDTLDGGAGDDTFDFRQIVLSDFANTTQTIKGGADKDVLLLPGHADQYDVTVDYNATNDTTKTTFFYRANGFTLVTTGLERVEFKDDIASEVKLSQDSITFEMLRLSDEVYGPLTTLTHGAEALASAGASAETTAMGIASYAAARGWTPLSGLELSLTPSDFGQGATGDAALRYSMVNGFYAATNGGTLLNDTAEGNAIVLEGVVKGAKTLAVSFRGTDQFADFQDYATFSDHYALFRPLIDGIKDFLARNPEITQVLVSGHSLGAGVAQYLTSELSAWDSASGHVVQLFTIGSPGSESPGAGGSLPALNLVNADDPIPFLGQLSQSLLVKGLAAAAGYFLGYLTSDAIFREVRDMLHIGDVDVVIDLLKTLQRKDVAGAQVIIDNHIASGAVPYDLDAHGTVVYLSQLARMLEFARDLSSPFSSSSLADALRSNSLYQGATVRIAMGSSPSPSDRSSYADSRYATTANTNVYALSEDNYVLGSSSADRLVVQSSEWLALAPRAGGGVQRDFDGGASRDYLVVEGLASKDIVVQAGAGGSVGVWRDHAGTLELIGTLWRVEVIVASDKAFLTSGAAANRQTPGGQSKLDNPAGATVPTFQLATGFDYADAGDGAMIVNGSGGADLLYVGDGAKTINLGAGTSTVVVRGRSADNNIVVNGGSGAVLVMAGGGNGTYYLHNAGDQVVVSGPDGFHSIHAYADYVLPAYADELVLEAGAVNGVGNDQGASLVGNAAANHLTGGGGDDLLTGKAGADVLEGGGGRDVAVYAATRASATVSHNADGSWTVNAGAEGTDTVSGVELLRFADRDMSLTTQATWNGDFNVDGGSDVLWRNSNGELYVWNSQNVGAGAFLGQTLGLVDNSWQVQAMGDYNGDGRADVLFRNTDGRVYVWNSNGGAGVSFTGQGLGSTPNAWRIQHGAGDFNGDGRDDVLWRHDNGEIYLWESQGQSPSDDAFLGHTLGVVGLDWQVNGLGDFNGDGRSDILWRNTGGDVYVSLSQTGANGVSLTGQSISYVPNDWQIQGVGDFNGDGRSDILWRNTSGEVYVWNSNTNTDVSFLGQSLGFAPTSWHIADIADFNGDGRSDVLWRGPAGEVFAWNSHASGAVAFDGQGLGTTAFDWQILTDSHP